MSDTAVSAAVKKPAKKTVKKTSKRDAPATVEVVQEGKATLRSPIPSPKAEALSTTAEDGDGEEMQRALEALSSASDETIQANKVYNEYYNYAVSKGIRLAPDVTLDWMLDHLAPLKEKEEMGVAYNDLEDLRCPLHPNDSMLHHPGSGYSTFACVWEECPFYCTDENYQKVVASLQRYVHPQVLERINDNDGFFCHCNLRPKMRLSQTAKNPNKVFLTCGAAALPEVEKCRFFQFMHLPIKQAKRKRQQHYVPLEPAPKSRPPTLQYLQPYVGPTDHPANRYLSTVGHQARAQERTDRAMTRADRDICQKVDRDIAEGPSPFVFYRRC